MKKKKIVVIALILAVMASISGCRGKGYVYWNVLKPDGIENSNSAVIMPIITMVRGTKRKYKTNNITMDFYYGSENGLTEYSEEENMQTIGVAVYFCNAKDLYTLYNNKEYRTSDYTKIEGLIFEKFIDIEEYNADEYKAKGYYMIAPEINHKETLTVPSKLIVSNPEDSLEEHFCLAVTAIVYFKDTNMYAIGNINGDINALLVRYNFIDKNTIELYGPYVTDNLKFKE